LGQGKLLATNVRWKLLRLQSLQLCNHRQKVVAPLRWWLEVRANRQGMRRALNSTACGKVWSQGLRELPAALGRQESEASLTWRQSIGGADEAKRGVKGWFSGPLEQKCLRQISPSRWRRSGRCTYVSASLCSLNLSLQLSWLYRLLLSLPLF